MSEDESMPQEDIFNESEPPKTPPGPPLTIKRKLVYISIFVIILIMGFTVIMAKLINENSQCTSNPFTYGASQIESSRGDPNPQCMCNLENEILCMCLLHNNGVFYFDDKEIYLENPLLNPLLN